MARKYMFDDPVELQKKIDAYFKMKDDDFDYIFDVVKSGQNANQELQKKVKKPPLLIELANYLGVTSHTVIRYKNKFTEEIQLKIERGEEVDNFEKIICIFARAHEKIQKDTIQGAMIGKYDASVARIVAGLQDTVNINQTSLQPVTINVLSAPVNLSALYDNNFVPAEVVQ